LDGNSNLIIFTSRLEQVSYQDCTQGNFPFTKIDKKDMRNYLPIEISQVSDKLMSWRIRHAAVALFMGYRCDTDKTTSYLRCTSCCVNAFRENCRETFGN